MRPQFRISIECDFNRTLKKYFRKPDGRQREDGVASATQIKSRTPTTLDAWAISQRRSTVSSQTARDLFVVGLRNAHAMEHQSQELMERQSERLTDFPEVHAKVNQHLQETRTQLNRLEECLEHLGESPSVLKDTALSALGNVTASTHAMAGDEILKDIFADDAFEHYEVAAYKSLLVLCERADISVAESPLQASLREEENMATWIDESVKDVTLSYLAKEERDRAAA
jgi:ferritin-like metal-binding protein YciE